MEVILFGGSNDGKRLMVLDDTNSLEMFIEPKDDTVMEMKRERYHKEIMHTPRKDFNLFAVDGMDGTMVIQSLIDHYWR